MITVKSKEELENAIKAGHKEIYVSGKDLQAACYLACKYQNLRSAMSSIAATIMSKVGKTAVISESTAIIITLFICITAVSIVAIIYKCDVEIDYKNGKLFVKRSYEKSVIYWS